MSDAVDNQEAPIERPPLSFGLPARSLKGAEAAITSLSPGRQAEELVTSSLTPVSSWPKNTLIGAER